MKRLLIVALLLCCVSVAVADEAKWYIRLSVSGRSPDTSRLSDAFDAQVAKLKKQGLPMTTPRVRKQRMPENPRYNYYVAYFFIRRPLTVDDAASIRHGFLALRDKAEAVTVTIIFCAERPKQIGSGRSNIPRPGDKRY